MRAWLAAGPALSVLVAGLIAWMGALGGADAFAIRAVSAVAVVAWIAPVASWAKAKGGVGFAVGLASKVAVFFALAPRGLATLTMSLAQVRDDFGLWQDSLVYFWALPPALTILTALEGWAIALRLAGRSLRDTWPYRRRRVLLGIVVPALAATLAWLVWRPAYYLSRIRAGDAPARFALARIGPRALPSIEREVHALGVKPAGSYRSDLVSVMVDIRQDEIARRIGTPLVWKVAAAQVGVDPPMVDALLSALVDEPDRDEREHIVNWMNGLDFDTSTELTCAAFPRLAPEGQGQLVHEWRQRVQTATSRSSSDTSPWQGLTEAAVDAGQVEMRRKLGCATPAVTGAIERDAPAWSESVPLWGTQAIRGLAALRPLPRAESARLGSLLSRLKDGYVLSLLLDGFGADLAGGDRTAMRALIASTNAKLEPKTRLTLRMWVADKGAAHGVPPGAFFCDVFDDAGADATQRYGLIAMLRESTDEDPCVATTLMASYTAIAPLQDIGPPWLDIAFGLLASRSAADPRIVPWARATLAQVENEYQAERLAKVAGVEPPKGRGSTVRRPAPRR